MKLEIRELKAAPGGKEILHGIDLAAHKGQFVGIIGPNGSGKSTLLKCVYRTLRPTGGAVLLDGCPQESCSPRQWAQKLAVVAQHNACAFDLTVEEMVRMGRAPHKRALERDTPQDRQTTARALAAVGMAGFETRSFSSLSGGEQQRVILARALAQQTPCLILDEPTNHLDFTTMEWLENYLKTYSGAVLVVSHDRYFLDNVCTKIWEVAGCTLTTYKGNFSAYLPQKEAADALRQKQHDADVALAEKLQDYIDRNLVRASTTKMAQSRRKQLEKLEITEAPKDETNKLSFRFEYDIEPWNELVIMKNLTISVGGRVLLEPFTHTVCRGQRLVIAGPNGAGKSTLMQVLDGKRRPSGGMVRLGTGARPSIFEQQQHRVGAGRVIDAIWDKYPQMTELEVRSHLARLGFRGETVFKDCSSLSGGELARLRFAEIVLERPNLLFLDEPTNHLDIYTRENLTEALMAYTGTLLLVTHDRHLMNSLACPILYLEDGKASIYPSYDALMGRSAPAAPAAEKSDAAAKAGYGKEQRRRRAELRAKIKACEEEMERCGAREVELDNEINSPEVYNDPQLLRQKSDELEDLRFHQEELFAAWEAAVEEQEQYERSLEDTENTGD